MNKANLNYEILTNDIFTGDNNKYYYFYKIVNLLNNHFYYGVHETYKLNDNYAGSGKLLIKKEKEYGIENFKKYILKFFNNHTDLYNYEKQIITHDLVLNKNCYNRHQGGEGSWDFTIGRVCVKDNNNNTFLVDINNPKYLSGELVSNMKGLIHVKDLNGNSITIPKNEYYKNKDKYKAYTINKVVAIDTNGIKKQVNKDEYDKLNKEGKLFGHTKGKGVFIDKNGNSIMCDINDSRVLSGELTGYTKKYTIYKFKNDFSKTCFTTKDDPRVLSGELVGINYGIIYCRNKQTGEKIKVLKDDPRLLSGELITSTKYFNTKERINKRILSVEQYIKKYQEIFDLYFNGKTIAEISNILNLKSKNVSHVIHLYKKKINKN